MDKFSGMGMDPTFVPELQDDLTPHDQIHAMEGMMAMQQPLEGRAAELMEQDDQDDGQETEPKKMTDDDLISIIQQKVETSHQWYGSGKLASKRIDADRYYRGEPLGNEQEGRSQVVSRDVAEAVESAMPSLMRIFAGGEQVVAFEPNGPEDEDDASQATDYINHVFMNENEGFMILYTWIKDSLLKKNGIIKIWHDVRMKRTKECYQGLTPEQLQSLQMNPDIQIENVQQLQDVVMIQDPATGLPMPQPAIFFNCDVIQLKPEKRIRVECVPPDEFIIERRAVSLATCGFCAHRGKRTISDLLECGFDEEKVMAIPTGDDSQYSSERNERFSDEDQLPYESDGILDPTIRKVWVTEAYIQCDYDGDGIAEWRCVTLASAAGSTGMVILSNEETDDHAFADLTPVPEPHKFYGQSIFDQTKDIQDIKTALLRGILDSTYLANSPRMGAVEGQVNLDDLLDSRPGGVVRMKRPDALIPIKNTLVSAEAMQVVEYIDAVKQRRTGIDSNSQAGINPDVLNSSATGADIINNASQQRLELMARVMSETGVKRAFRRIFQLVCQYQDVPRTVRLRNKWIQVDPRSWKDRMDVSATVGLGLGSKTQQAAIARSLLEVDAQIIQMQGGVDGPIVKIDNVYNKLVKLVEAVGWKTPDPYYTDPRNAEPPPPKPPTPEQQIHMKELESKAVQAQAQADKAKADAFGGIESKKLDFEMKKLDLLIKQTEYAALKLTSSQTLAKRADNETMDSEIPGGSNG